MKHMDRGKHFDVDEGRMGLLSYQLNATIRQNTSRRLKPNIKTVLGDAIHWDSLKLPLRGCANDPTQIWRCRKHKKIEAKCLLTLPIHSSFLDCGSHFGDTTLTMAIHARVQGRNDLRFIAIEPSRRKCKFIRSMVRANGLEGSVKIINACVGEVCRQVVPIDEKGFDIYDGRVAYSEIDAKDKRNDNMTIIPKEILSRKHRSPFYYDGQEKVDESGSESESDESDDDDCGIDTDSRQSVSMISLDSLKTDILPLGLLHLDVEGWESKALHGANDILRETTETCYIVCEVWSDKDRKMRKKAIIDAEGGRDIIAAMDEFPQFERLDDIVDQERNLFFRVSVARNEASS